MTRTLSKKQVMEKEDIEKSLKRFNLRWYYFKKVFGKKLRGKTFWSSLIIKAC